MRARGVTCQMQLPTPTQRRVSCGADMPALAVTRDEAQHSSLLNVRAVPRWLWSSRVVPAWYEGALRRPEASFLRRALVMHRTSCGLQRQAIILCLARRRCACARCRWNEAQHSSILHARAAPRWVWLTYT